MFVTPGWGGNGGSGEGGAVYAADGTQVTAWNLTVAGNLAQEDTGGAGGTAVGGGPGNSGTTGGSLGGGFRNDASSTTAFINTLVSTNTPGGNACGTITLWQTDQRGYVRPNRADIGAYEFGGSVVGPTITVLPTENNLTLSWPVTPTAYRVESVSNLSPPTTWSNVTGVFQTNGGLISIALPITGGQSFYRLINP